ncbi:MAG: ATP-binding protein [Candidatus Omnitrophica bacterium]|nr:ATP-binding protein [Candidatus Omnitrophota bacterium]
MNKQLDFRISSGLKNIIGKELITNDRIAIFELVKNSYDANAKLVRIVFQDIKDTGKGGSSRILIIDDGDGMSHDDLVKKWLFVGYSEKKDDEKEPARKSFRDKIKNKRVFAGAKGVGRFSCDRLGTKLKLYTRKEGEKGIHFLDVNWQKFEEDQEKEFQTIKINYSTMAKVEIEDYPVKEFKNGTILEISSLNDKWDAGKLLELRKYLQRLINPSSIEEQEFKIYLEAREFLENDKKVKKEEDFNLINGPVKNIVFEKLGIKTTELKSSITGGKVRTELIDKGKSIFVIEERSEYPGLDNITVNLFYLSQAAKNTFTRVMGVEPKNYGSIFLYKNKFRIHPYGDEGDDWLGLEKRKGQGYARYLANRELMGRIELHGPQPGFEEVSSRDGGVLKTQEFQHLQDYFIEKILRRLEKYVVEGIDWDKEDAEKQKSPEEIKRDSLELIQKLAGQVKDPEKNIQFNSDLLTILKDKQIENLPQVIKNIESLNKYVKAPEQKAYIEKQLKSVRLATRNLEIEKGEKEEELKAKERESLFLTKVVSTDKEIITSLNHTIENSTKTIKEIVIDINKKIHADRPISEIAPFVDELSIENEKIMILANIVGMANFKTKVELIKKDVVLYVKEYLERIVKAEIMKFRFSNEGIEHVVEFRPLEISIVLDNLISNAKKAGATTMAIKFKMLNKKLHIHVSDNGKGVDNKMLNKLFKRGETTTNGSGIGLHHIKTIIEKMGGEVKFVGNDVEDLGKGACFEVILP